MGYRNFCEKKTAQKINKSTKTDKLNNQQVKEEIKKEIKNTWRQVKMEIQHTKTYGIQQKVQRGKFIVINAHIKKQQKGLPWWRSG